MPVFAPESSTKVPATTTSEKLVYGKDSYYITAGDGTGEVIADAYVVDTEFVYICKNAITNAEFEVYSADDNLEEYVIWNGSKYTVSGKPEENANVIGTITKTDAIIPAFKHYNAYALTDLLKICGEYGENLVKIINDLLGPVLLGKDATEEELAGFKLLEDTFFSDYAAHAITINKKTANPDYYYFVEEANGNWIKVKDDLYEESMGTIVETHYVVDWFKVDIADSAVYLLDNVLSESLLTEIAKLAKVDLADEDNILAGILNNLIDGNFNGLAVADLITALFENYTITYNELYGEYITPDHSHLDSLNVYTGEGDEKTLDAEATADKKDKAAKVPGQLDTIIKEALPAIGCRR